MRARTGMRSAPARLEHRQKAALTGLLSQWTMRWFDKVLAACERNRTAVADDGPASPGHGNHGPALGVVMMLSGVKRRCYSFRDSPTILLLLLSPTKLLLLIRTGCPS